MTIETKVRRGHDKKLYRSTAADYTTPVWDEVDTLASNKISREASGKEYHVRKSNFVGVRPGKTKLGLTIEFADIAGDLDIAAFEAAVENGTPMILAYADGDMDDAGTKYTQAVYSITKIDTDEPEDDIAKKTFEASVTNIESYEPFVDTTT